MAKVTMCMETIQFSCKQCSTVATWKAPLWGSSTLQMVSFPRPLNNNSALCLPGPDVLNGYDAKWKQISRALLFNWALSVYFLETVIIDSKIPIKLNSEGRLSHLAPLDSVFHMRRVLSAVLLVARLPHGTGHIFSHSLFLLCDLALRGTPCKSSNRREVALTSLS